MNIALIWAQDANGLIGAGGQLPWRLPADMAWFKKNTLGKPVLMGRKTYDSIGRPLPGRHNIILTAQDISIDGCTVTHSLDAALEVAGQASVASHQTTELMVMGGAQVYQLALPQAERLYISNIHAAFEGDTHFPAFDPAAWREIFCENHLADEKNLHPYSFHIFERKDKAQ